MVQKIKTNEEHSFCRPATDPVEIETTLMKPDDRVWIYLAKAIWLQRYPEKPFPIQTEDDFCNEDKIMNLLVPKEWGIYSDNDDPEQTRGYEFPDGTVGIAFQSEWDYYDVAAIGWFDFEMSMEMYTGKDKPIVWKIASIFFSSIMEAIGDGSYYVNHIREKAKEELASSELNMHQIHEKYKPFAEAYQRISVDVIKNRIRKMFLKYQKVVIPDPETVKRKKLKSLIESYLFWMECCWAEAGAYKSICDEQVNEYVSDPYLLEYTLSLKDIMGTRIREFISNDQDDDDDSDYESTHIMFPIYKVIDQFNQEHEVNAAFPFTSVSILIDNLRRYEKRQIIKSNDIFRIEKFIKRNPL